MNSRPVVRCQNINANVIQLDPEHQRCRTHYKETACVSSVKHERELALVGQRVLLKRSNIHSITTYCTLTHTEEQRERKLFTQ